MNKKHKATIALTLMSIFFVSSASMSEDTDKEAGDFYTICAYIRQPNKLLHHTEAFDYVSMYYYRKMGMSYDQAYDAKGKAIWSFHASTSDNANEKNWAWDDDVKLSTVLNDHYLKNRKHREESTVSFAKSLKTGKYK